MSPDVIAPDFALLEGALAKVTAGVPADAFTRAETDALNFWLMLSLGFQGKETRAERSARRKAAWSSGDRREFGGEIRRRDPRRGWRNFK